MTGMGFIRGTSVRINLPEASYVASTGPVQGVWPILARGKQR
jgi:hypothetical protein